MNPMVFFFLLTLGWIITITVSHVIFFGLFAEPRMVNRPLSFSLIWSVVIGSAMYALAIILVGGAYLAYKIFVKG